MPPVKTRATESQTADRVMSRKWRCSTFDRALVRYNKNWLISREEFLRDFYIEFENEEYEKDVLRTGVFSFFSVISLVRLFAIVPSHSYYVEP